jgi:phosphohistidine phosphatase SixA
VLRRPFIVAALGYPVAAMAQEAASAVSLLREGGVVVAMRHALAPGTFDPPEFKLDDCATQRNLSDEGRAQAKRIGQWFERHGLKPDRVRSSPWCRCIDTANLAFGSAQPWSALASPRGATDSANAQAQRELALAVKSASLQIRRFEVWVTHQFVLTDLVGVAADSGEGLLLKLGKHGVGVQLVGRLPAL